jgi:nitronate monooxygenase
MWPNRQLCDLLEIEHPIIQAPMAGSATPELAAAVSNAGGLGSLGCGAMTPAETRDIVQRLRAGTNRPFNLNFFAYPEPHTSKAVRRPSTGCALTMRNFLSALHPRTYPP